MPKTERLFMTLQEYAENINKRFLAGTEKKKEVFLYNNIFDIMQGVLIAIFLKRGKN